MHFCGSMDPQLRQLWHHSCIFGINWTMSNLAWTSKFGLGKSPNLPVLLLRTSLLAPRVAIVLYINRPLLGFAEILQLQWKETKEENPSYSKRNFLLVSIIYSMQDFTEESPFLTAFCFFRAYNLDIRDIFLEYDRGYIYLPYSSLSSISQNCCPRQSQT